VRSPSPIRSSGKDASWRDKLGAGEKPAQRDTLDVEKPSEYYFSRIYRGLSSCSSERKERRDPPKFSEQLADLTVFEGKDHYQHHSHLDRLGSLGSATQFRCEVKGKPTPTIEWLKNGEVMSICDVVRPSARKIVVFSPCQLNLEFKQHTKMI
jgi:hypothetical protein